MLAKRQDSHGRKRQKDYVNNSCHGEPANHETSSKVGDAVRICEHGILPRNRRIAAAKSPQAGPEPAKLVVECRMPRFERAFSAGAESKRTCLSFRRRQSKERRGDTHPPGGLFQGTRTTLSLQRSCSVSA